MSENTNWYNNLDETQKEYVRGIFSNNTSGEMPDDVLNKMSKEDFWKYLLGYLNDNHPLKNDNDSFVDGSFAKVVGEKIDYEVENNKNSWNDSVQDLIYGLRKILENIKKYKINNNGKICGSDDQEITFKTFTTELAAFFAKVGNAVYSLDSIPYVSPPQNYSGETYKEVRGKDIIPDGIKLKEGKYQETNSLQKIDNSQENSDNSQENSNDSQESSNDSQENSDNSQENFWVNLLMPKYSKEIEVEDLNRNFWVISQVLSALSWYLFQDGLKNNLKNNLADIINELTQLWDNVILLWAALAKNLQNENTDLIHYEVLYLNQPNSYSHTMKFDNFEKEGSYFIIDEDNGTADIKWDIIQKEYEQIVSLNPSSNLVIAPVIRIGNYKKNYYNCEYWPGLSFYSKGTRQWIHKEFLVDSNSDKTEYYSDFVEPIYKIYEENGKYTYDNQIIPKNGIYIDLKAPSLQEQTVAIHENELNYEYIEKLSNTKLNKKEKVYYGLLRTTFNFNMEKETTIIDESEEEIENLKNIQLQIEDITRTNAYGEDSKIILNNVENGILVSNDLFLDFEHNEYGTKTEGDFDTNILFKIKRADNEEEEEEDSITEYITKYRYPGTDKYWAQINVYAKERNSNDEWQELLPPAASSDVNLTTYKNDHYYYLTSNKDFTPFNGRTLQDVLTYYFGEGSGVANNHNFFHVDSNFSMIDPVFKIKIIGKLNKYPIIPMTETDELLELDDQIPDGALNTKYWREFLGDEADLIAINRIEEVDLSELEIQDIENSQQDFLSFMKTFSFYDESGLNSEWKQLPELKSINVNCDIYDITNQGIGTSSSLDLTNLQYNLSLEKLAFVTNYIDDTELSIPTYGINEKLTIQPQELILRGKFLIKENIISDEKYSDNLSLLKLDLTDFIGEIDEESFYGNNSLYEVKMPSNKKGNSIFGINVFDVDDDSASQIEELNIYPKTTIVVNDTSTFGDNRLYKKIIIYYNTLNEMYRYQNYFDSKYGDSVEITYLPINNGEVKIHNGVFGYYQGEIISSWKYIEQEKISVNNWIIRGLPFYLDKEVILPSEQNSNIGTNVWAKNSNGKNSNTKFFESGIDNYGVWSNGSFLQGFYTNENTNGQINVQSGKDYLINKDYISNFIDFICDMYPNQKIKQLFKKNDENIKYMDAISLYSEACEILRKKRQDSGDRSESLYYISLYNENGNLYWPLAKKDNNKWSLTQIIDNTYQNPISLSGEGYKIHFYGSSVTGADGNIQWNTTDNEMATLSINPSSNNNDDYLFTFTYKLFLSNLEDEEQKYYDDILIIFLLSICIICGQSVKINFWNFVPPGQAGIQSIVEDQVARSSSSSPNYYIYDFVKQESNIANNSVNKKPFFSYSDLLKERENQLLELYYSFKEKELKKEKTYKPEKRLDCYSLEHFQEGIYNKSFLEVSRAERNFLPRKVLIFSKIDGLEFSFDRDDDGTFITLIVDLSKVSNFNPTNLYLYLKEDETETIINYKKQESNNNVYKFYYDFKAFSGWYYFKIKQSNEIYDATYNFCVKQLENDSLELNYSQGSLQIFPYLSIGGYDRDGLIVKTPQGKKYHIDNTGTVKTAYNSNLWQWGTQRDVEVEPHNLDRDQGIQSARIFINDNDYEMSEDNWVLEIIDYDTYEKPRDHFIAPSFSQNDGLKLNSSITLNNNNYFYPELKEFYYDLSIKYPSITIDELLSSEYNDIIDSKYNNYGDKASIKESLEKWREYINIFYIKDTETNLYFLRKQSDLSENYISPLLNDDINVPWPLINRNGEQVVGILGSVVQLMIRILTPNSNGELLDICHYDLYKYDCRVNKASNIDLERIYNNVDSLTDPPITNTANEEICKVGYFDRNYNRNLLTPYGVSSSSQNSTSSLDSFTLYERGQWISLYKQNTNISLNDRIKHNGDNYVLYSQSNQMTSNNTKIINPEKANFSFDFSAYPSNGLYEKYVPHWKNERVNIKDGINFYVLKIDGLVSEKANLPEEFKTTCDYGELSAPPLIDFKELFSNATYYGEDNNG